METLETIALITHMIVWGAFSVLLVVCAFLFSRFLSSDKSLSLVSKALMLVAFVIVFPFFAYGSVECFYTVTNKLFANPKPSNPTELYVDGKEYMEYQDTKHLCDAKDENSPCFKSRTLVGEKPSKDDICEHCGKKFRFHYTREEQRYCNNTDYSISY